MKEALPVIAAGGAFAGTTLVALAAGVVAAAHTGNQLWAFAGLVAGIGLGGYAAARLLFRAP